MHMCVYTRTHRFAYVLNHIVLKKKLKCRGVRRLGKGFMFTCNKRGIPDLPHPRPASLLRLCPESQLYLREKKYLENFCVVFKCDRAPVIQNETHGTTIVLSLIG